MKSKHAEVIKAWADGAVVQRRATTDHPWTDCAPAGHDLAPVFSNMTQYRVKPEIKRYRVCILKPNNVPYAVRPEQYRYFENAPSFVKWITSEIEYEVTP